MTQFVSYNFSGTNHCDPHDKIPSLGWWCQDGTVVTGGMWWFSCLNILLEFNPVGTLMLFDGKIDEHGTGAFSEDSKGIQIGTVLIVNNNVCGTIIKHNL